MSILLENGFILTLYLVLFVQKSFLQIIQIKESDRAINTFIPKAGDFAIQKTVFIRCLIFSSGKVVIYQIHGMFILFIKYHYKQKIIIVPKPNLTYFSNFYFCVVPKLFNNLHDAIKVGGNQNLFPDTGTMDHQDRQRQSDGNKYCKR